MKIRQTYLYGQEIYFFLCRLRKEPASCGNLVICYVICVPVVLVLPLILH